MTKEVRISRHVYDILNSLPKKDGSLILEAVLWQHFYGHYSELGAHNQAIYQLIMFDIANEDTIAHFTQGK
jgi:hypothetical protein